jgi:hypothetical protein
MGKQLFLGIQQELWKKNLEQHLVEQKSQEVLLKQKGVN